MGGSIAVTVREESGKEHRMCRWTNVLPWFVNNLNLITKDQSHLQEYLEAWYDMKADYAKHKHNQRFENGMTGCYAPYPFLAPREYGLVVVDMQKSHILTNQGYSHLGVIDNVAIKYDIVSNGERAFYLDDGSETTRFRKLFEAGKITEARHYLDKKRIVPLSGMSLDDVISLVNDDNWGGLYFPINISPFTLAEYGEHDAEEAERMRNDIRNLGFVLSRKENKIWEKWMAEARVEE